MTITATMYSALERADSIAVAASRVLTSRTAEVDAIFLFGLIAVAVGVGSLIYGLRTEWRRTHTRYRRRRD